MKKDALYGENEITIDLTIDEISMYGFLTIYPDFLYKNKIIEFNGDYWHCNPKQYGSNSHARNKLMVSDVWKKDHKRLQFLKSRGYDILVIWESDYRENSKMVVAKCLGFLND